MICEKCDGHETFDPDSQILKIARGRVSMGLGCPISHVPSSSRPRQEVGWPGTAQSVAENEDHLTRHRDMMGSLNCLMTRVALGVNTGLPYLVSRPQQGQ